MAPDRDVDGRHIVIIGGGWSGVAAAIHLLQRGGAQLRVSLVERSTPLGRGIAYGSDDPGHILNVPASRMSLDPARPDEFLQYMRDRGVAAGPNSLLPRQQYGDYVVERLTRTVRESPGQLRVIKAEAIALHQRDGGWDVSLADTLTLTARDVILATGHGAPRLPDALQPFSAEPTLLTNPWAPRALAMIPNDAKVVMIGSGLTSLDLLGTLRRQGHRAPIEVLSLTGEWPRPHLASVVWEGPPFAIDVDTLPGTADGLAAWFQDAFAAAKEKGIPWQAVMDAFRPHTVAVWKALPLEERRRFLSRWRPTWELFRHRAPRPQLEALRQWEAEGWVRRTAGTLHGAEKRGSHFVLKLQDDSTRSAGYVVIATGPESDVQRLPSPLWRQLLSEGVVEPDPLRLGIVTDDLGAVISAGVPAPGLWTLGSLVRPQLFESTAVPDLSKRAAALSDAILAR